MKCQALIRKCRSCEEPVATGYKGEVCESCGEDRKCKASAIYPTNYCGRHGTNLRHGVSKGFPIKHGANSNILFFRMYNEFMTEKYRKLTDKVSEAQKDPELLSLRRQLATHTVRQEMLMNRLDTPESDQRWALLIKAWNQYAPIGLRFKMNPKEAVKFKQVNELIEGAYHDYRAWQQLFESFEMQKKLGESERKRLVEMNQMMRYEDVMDIALELFNIINETVDDPRKLTTIQLKFARLFGSGNPEEFGNSDSSEDIVGPNIVDSTEFLDTRDGGADTVDALSDSVFGGSLTERREG